MGLNISWGMWVSVGYMCVNIAGRSCNLSQALEPCIIQSVIILISTERKNKK